MLIMKWKTDHEGRLVASWEETRRCGTALSRVGSAEVPRQPTSALPAKRMGFFINLHSRAWNLSIIRKAIRTTRMLLYHILDRARAFSLVRGR